VKLAKALAITAAALVLAAAAADMLARLLGGERGIFAGVLAACLITGLCGLASHRPRRHPGPTRSAGDVTVTKPKPLADLPR
jgi:hypothetical protein